MPLIRPLSNMHHDRKERVQSITILCRVRRVKQPQLQRERDPILELNVPPTVLLVLEALEVECENSRCALELEPLLGFVEPAAGVAEELIGVAQHL
jgi:hypothetical protein